MSYMVPTRALAAPRYTSRPHLEFSIELAVLRTLDILLASLALIFMAPVFVIVAVLVYLGDPGPIFFGHRRLGMHGREFRCLKFRSMRMNADVLLAELLTADPVARAEWLRDFKLERDVRVTGVGRFLRQSSLDELPQFWNVLRGDMSIVGPRPIVAEEAPRYGWRIGHYYSAKPGMTGLWQVSGRSRTTYRRRIAADVTYARRRNVRTYMSVLLATPLSVLAGQGAY